MLQLWSDRAYKECLLYVADKDLYVDLLSFDIGNFGIILVMNWLTLYHSFIDCFRKNVVFQMPNDLEFRF